MTYVEEVCRLILIGILEDEVEHIGKPEVERLVLQAHVPRCPSRFRFAGQFHYNLISVWRTAAGRGLP